MDLFITSIKGKLVQNNKVLKNTKLFFPKEKYIKGDLTTPVSIKNIHSISDTILDVFIRTIKSQSKNIYYYNKIIKPLKLFSRKLIRFFSIEISE